MSVCLSSFGSPPLVSERHVPSERSVAACQSRSVASLPAWHSWQTCDCALRFMPSNVVACFASSASGRSTGLRSLPPPVPPSSDSGTSFQMQLGFDGVSLHACKKSSAFFASDAFHSASVAKFTSGGIQYLLCASLYLDRKSVV